MAAIVPQTPVVPMYFPRDLKISYHPLRGGEQILAMYAAPSNPDLRFQIAGINQQQARLGLLHEIATAYWRLSQVPREKLLKNDVPIIDELERIAKAGKTGLPSDVMLGIGRIGSTPFYLREVITAEAEQYEKEDTRIKGVRVKYQHPMNNGIVITSVGMNQHEGLPAVEARAIQLEEAVDNLLTRLSYRLHGFEQREEKFLDPGEVQLRDALRRIIGRDRSFTGKFKW